MLTITGVDGSVLSRSRNLRGIREYMRSNAANYIHLSREPHGAGRMEIRFANGAHFATSFASYTVMCRFVRRWRSAYGTSLILRENNLTSYCGYVDYRNAWLMI